MCIAEISIGTLQASAVKGNKKQAKLWAAKNLLKTIHCNTFLREKFLYYSKNMRELNNRHTQELKKKLMVESPKTKKEQEEEEFEGELEVIDPDASSVSFKV